MASWHLAGLEQLPKIPLTAFLTGTDDSVSGDAVRNQHCPIHPLKQIHDSLPLSRSSTSTDGCIVAHKLPWECVHIFLRTKDDTGNPVLTLVD